MSAPSEGIVMHQSPDWRKGTQAVIVTGRDCEIDAALRKIDQMQRTIEHQAEQIRKLAKVLYQHDLIGFYERDEFEPRKEGGAT